MSQHTDSQLIRMAILIRPAITADIPALCELLDHLFNLEAEFTPNTEAQHRALTHIIDNPETGLIVIAQKNQQVVAMVSLLYTISTALGDRVAWLEDMIVSPTHHNEGIGTRLLTHTLSIAHNKGCKRITLLTDLTNTAAQAFYQRFGFTSSSMMPMRLLLDDVKID